MNREKKEIPLIFFPYEQKVNSIYNETFSFLKSNYNFIYAPSKISQLTKLKNNLLIRDSYYFLINVLRKLGLKSKNKEIIFPKESLLFCFNQLPPEGYNFILDLEIVIGLSKYDYHKLNKEYLKSRLESKYCKSILCWNNSSYQSLVNLIDCSNFKNKIKIIPFGRKSSKFIKKENKNINLLFVSSVNNPKDFETKGGILALEVYSQLAKKFNNLKFYIRANVPKSIEKKYKNIPGIIFLKKYLSQKEMNSLLKNSDILLEPVPGISLMLECMDYKIVPVSFDYWCIKDMIFNKKSGFLIDSSSIFGKSYNDLYFKNLKDNYDKLYDLEILKKFIQEYVLKLEKLIYDKKLKKKMGNYQKGLLVSGPFQPERRNLKLKKIIDSILDNFK